MTAAPPGAPAASAGSAVAGASAPGATGGDAGTERKVVTPIEQLCRTLEIERRRTRLERWHPRADKLWVSRTGGRYSLSAHKGGRIMAITHDGLRQLGAVVDAPLGLLERLSGLPNAEDCRLLNLLLQAAGADAAFQLQFELQDEQVVGVQASSYVRLDLVALAGRLHLAETAGQIRLRRYEYAGGRLWLELEHPSVAAFDLSAGADRAPGKADLWRAGAILSSEDDGAHAITVCPALFRTWGGSAIPVVQGRGDIRKRRHAQTDTETLLRQVVGDVLATQTSPFADAADRLRALHTKYLPSRGLDSVLESAAIPFPTAAVRDATIKTLAGGKTTWYRLLAAIAKEGRTVEDSRKRLTMLLSVGRHLWIRRGQAKDSAPTRGQTTPPTR